MLLALTRVSRNLRQPLIASSFSVQRQVHTCTCAASPEAARLGLQQPLFPAQPGTVAAFQHHVFVRAWHPLKSAAEACASWPAVVEREPALAKVFAAVAQNKQHIEGVVRVTAFEALKPVTLQQDCCEVSIFPAGVQYINLSIEELPLVVRAHTSTQQAGQLSDKIRAFEDDEAFSKMQLYVCCHGSRDARCGLVGPALSTKLQRLVDMRGLQDSISVNMCSHIGGHKFAGNVLVYGALSPSDGDWFGGVSAENAESFMDALLDLDVDSDGGPSDERLKRWWRGRLGYSKQEQLEFYQTGKIPDSVRPAESDIEADEQYVSAEETDQDAQDLGIAMPSR